MKTSNKKLLNQFKAVTIKQIGKIKGGKATRGTNSIVDDLNGLIR